MPQVLYALHQLCICDLYFLLSADYIGLVPTCVGWSSGEKNVSWVHMDRARPANAPGQAAPASSVSPGLRLLGNILRVAFIACLLVLTVRVAMPQNETLWTVYDTPGDVVRLALGFAVCVWVAIQLFRPPKDAHGYRMWTWFGLIGVPFAIICLIAIW
jgi:hypothetical protein